jgi:hypothetical protein
MADPPRPARPAPRRRRTDPPPQPRRGEPPAGRARSAYALQDDRVEEALITGEHRDLLEAYFGEGVYDELRGLATRARTARRPGGPRVLILPGIMGSKLGTRGLLFDDALWLDPLDIAAGRLTHLRIPGGDPAVVPLGVLLLAYLKLKLRLQLAGLDADFYPFDWRRSIPELGAELAERVRAETVPASGRQALYLVAHSMGGLVGRAALARLDAAGEGARVARLVMLGTPNFGSFSPVQALSGYHPLVRRVAALDLRHSHEALVNGVFATFPGLYQMLPAPSRFNAIDLYDPASWPPTGVAPRPELLAAAPRALEHLAAGDARAVLVAGVNQDTIVAVRREGDEFRFARSQEGDGTVPLALARLDGVATYYVEEQHGGLANHRDVARAVVDLIEKGRTDALPEHWSPALRALPVEVPPAELTAPPFAGRRAEELSPREHRHLIHELAAPPRLERQPAAAAPALAGTAVSGEPVVVGRRRQQRLDLRLAHGSVTQVDTRAIVLGLFRGVAPSGAAAAVDRELDGVVTDFAERRLLSASAGQVFIMPASRYRMGADMVVFVGLGSYDEFDEEVLRLAAENVARALVRTKVDEFASVLLSSASGMATAEVLANLLQGFLRGLGEADRQGRLRSITLCETDPQRFREMQQELLRLATSPLFDAVEATLEALELSAPAPPAPAVRAVAPGPDPVYLIVREAPAAGARATDPSLAANFQLRASLLTAGHKATVITDTVEVDAERLNRHLEIIETDAFGFAALEDFGRTLGQLVLPRLVRTALAGVQDRRLVVIHDARCSRIPWETVRLGGWAPAAAPGLSRKYEAEDLTVAKWLEERRLAERLSVLLVINPTADLPGADAEGDRIKALLARDPAVEIAELRRAEATFGAVRAALRSGRYDVVHYAGHAFFDPVRRSRSGVLCHGGQVLSGHDLTGLERLPALVFFNACESGRVRGQDPRVHSGRARDAGRGTVLRLERNVGLAEAFLRAGIANYLGTYWPVGDDAAMAFGEAFYRALVRGQTLGDAVQAGRDRVRAVASPDWATYVHYGSPGFLVKRPA